MADNTSADAQSVLFNRNFDKDCQHEIETGIADLIGRVTGYCTEVGTTIITDPGVVGSVLGRSSKILQLCKQLYWKYREDERESTDRVTKIKTVTKTEGYQKILDLEDELAGIFNINAHQFILKLKAVQEREIQDIAVKHKIMDRVSENQPWEGEVAQKFFLE
jgi:hypothetical protein